MRHNRVCLTCGKSYTYCNSCTDDIHLPVWKNIFDTENCKNIFEIVSDYEQKVIDKEKAKNKLLKYDLSNKGEFKPHVKKIIEEIIFVEEKQIKDVNIKQESEENTDKILSVNTKAKRKISDENKNND